MANLPTAPTPSTAGSGCRCVDHLTGSLPIPEDPVESAIRADAQIHANSVMLSDGTRGAIAPIDLVEAAGARATPVDYKRPAVPDFPGNAYGPERAQLCLQGLLLRANGFQCDERMLYFAQSKRRISVP